jgi:glycosyltransferase involved in cell wall biosynthesis
MRVLFFLPYSLEAAGCRYRVHQFVPYLEQHGVTCELRELVKPDLYKILYKPGHRLEKAARFTRGAIDRIKDVRDARDYDVLFVYRECFPFGPAFIERQLRQLGRPIVYDFDDAIYLPSGDPVKDLLRMPEKTNVITQLADDVIVCNEHLRRLCLAYNQNVHVIPTSVETEKLFFARSYSDTLPPADGRPVRLGWVGSHSTAKYLYQLAPVLKQVAERHPVELLVVGAGRDIDLPGVTVINKTWGLATEVDDFRSIDIGLYPLHDDLWELGKTSFKTIQYMAVGVPGVVSRVGTAIDIVRDGENGFLASTEAEWVAKICRLIEDPELRRRVGEAGRRTAVEGFSVASNAPKLLEVLKLAAGRRSSGAS